MDLGSQRQAFYAAVFERLVEELGSPIKVPAFTTRGQQTFKSGSFGAYWIWFAGDGLRVVAYVDRRDGTAADNAALVDGVRSLVPKLEELAGEPVTIDADPERRAQWIGFVRPNPDLDDPAAVEEAAAWAAGRAADLIDVLDVRLRTGSTEPVTVPKDPVAATPAEHANVKGDDWAVLQWEIARALRAMKQGWLSIASPSTANEVSDSWSGALFVQVHLGDEVWRAECTHDRTLLAPHLLTSAQRSSLERLGWLEPEEAAAGKPNDLTYHRPFAKGDVEGVAALLVATARDVLRLRFDDLDYTTGTGDGRSWALPYLPIPMEARHRLRRDAPSREAAERFERCIAVFRKTDIVLRENDGDHRIPFDEGPTLTLRLTGNPTPFCKIFSVVRPGIAASLEVLRAVNELNASFDLAKVLLTRGTLVSAGDVPMSALDDASFLAAISQVFNAAKAALEEVPVVTVAPADRSKRPPAGYL